ncbi:MAG: response regulator transcription factor [Deltaproteobacteria bacterium]|nr:response regulator transcription factor [Deltaproteobacteria bacterium]
MPIKVFVADDHKIFREGLKTLLEMKIGVEVVGEASDGREALREIIHLKPDIVIMDISMPNLNGIDATLNGIDATHQIVSANPNIKVMILSMHKDESFVKEALKAGAIGYMIKDGAFSELLDAIKTIMAGKIYLSPTLNEIIVKGFVDKLRVENLNSLSVLTSREREVLQLIAEGKSTSQIGDIMCISIKTVETHRQNIMKKLNINTVAGLVKYAIQKGLVFLE